MTNLDRYKRLVTPPADAVKPIAGGKLKGKSDISPQWKIEAMTAEYGECGVGWYFDIIEKEVVNCSNGEVMLFMRVAVYTKQGAYWSKPVYGMGGDFIIELQKGSLVCNDEAWKMCLTDALGNACKCLGVAADVYRGKFDGSKYNKAAAEESPKQEYVAAKEGETYVFVQNKWHKLADLNAQQLNYITNSICHKAAHDEARKLLMEKAQNA